MTDKKTVLILGAGASVPYFYPTMEKLRTDIIDNFEEYFERWFISPTLDKDSKSEEMYKVQNFIKRYDKSDVIIDEFLSEEDNADIRWLGKIAIACSIIAFEEKSKFREQSKDPDSDWYTSIYRMLRKRLPLNEKYRISNLGISFVTFNYDRSLEYFLYDTLTATYPNRVSQIIDEINKIDIPHIYGQIQRMSWQNPKYFENKTHHNDYRKINNYLQIESCAKNIYIMLDQREDNIRVKAAKKLIQKADSIFFLGFGFDPLNLKVLGFPEIIKPDHDIFWTTYKLDLSVANDIENIFNQNKKNTKFRISEDTNCKELIDKYLFAHL